MVIQIYNNTSFGLPIVSRLLDEMDKKDQETALEEEVLEEENQQEQEEQEENQEEEQQQQEEKEEGDENQEIQEEIEEKSPPVEKTRFLRCLILTPTRELALQISKHMKQITKNTPIKIAEIVGGMSTEKQERLLKNEPEIVIGTTGRVWDMMKQNSPHLTNFKQLSFFVLDEADRMITDGHFPELKDILNLIFMRRKGKKGNYQIQNIICSATLTLPSKFKTNKKHKQQEDQKSIDQIMNIIYFKEQPEIVDLSTSNLMAKKLTESQIQCVEEDRLFYAYYFIHNYPGRTMMFVNSIGVARHIYGTFQLLKIPCTILHGELQQKQRLKNLDKFLKDQHHVLITTDVASRGIDIKNVDHVIHYDLPKSPDIYVHRCGRTARAFNDGLSLALVSPQDKKFYHDICKATKKSNGIDQFPIDHRITRELRERIRLAKNIENIQAKHKKSKSNASWFIKNAEELDIEIDEHFFPDMKKKANTELNDRELIRMQEQLNRSLAQDLKSKKLISKKYLTIEPQNVEILMSKENPDAKKDFQKKKKRKRD